MLSLLDSAQLTLILFLGKLIEARHKAQQPASLAELLSLQRGKQDNYHSEEFEQIVGTYIARNEIREKLPCTQSVTMGKRIHYINIIWLRLHKGIWPSCFQVTHA